jgi:hypothetical protein
MDSPWMCLPQQRPDLPLPAPQHIDYRALAAAALPRDAVWRLLQATACPGSYANVATTTTSPPHKLRGREVAVV